MIHPINISSAGKIQYKKRPIQLSAFRYDHNLDKWLVWAGANWCTAAVLGPNK